MTDDAKSSIGQSVRGADRAFRVIDGGSTPAPPRDGGDERCPVTALGHLAGVFHFLDIRGQKRELSARQLGARHELLSLFGGDDSWLRANHPKRINLNGRDREAEPDWKTVDFHVNEAAAALQRACFGAGLFGEHVLLRRPGVWRGPDDTPVVHCGDAVLIGEVWQPAGVRTGNQVWAAAPPTPRPDLGCAVSVARDLQAGLTSLWRWRDAGGPLAVMGLLGNAYLGAATEWRPAGFVTGETGTGKSALQKVLRAALPLHHYSNDTSKAGIEQAVQGRAMPIIIDEAADRANRSGARELIDLVLSAAGDEGTKGTRGTVDGKGRTIELAGLIIMFSINPPDLEPQHLGRFVIVELLEADVGDDFRAQHRALAQQARAAARGLWGRALAGWDRYNGALERFRAVLAQVGCAPREMDQAGALLAGWWLLVHEGLPDERHVREGVAALDGFVRVSRDVASDSRSRRALNHLLTALVSLHRSTDREPLGKLIEIAFRPMDEIRSPDDARELLSYYGIRVVRRCVNHGLPPAAEGCRCAECLDRQRRPVPRLSDDAGIWLANGHAQLRAIFENSPFHGDKWRSELGRLPQARPSRRSIRVGKSVGHALWIPRDELDGLEDVPDG